MPVISVYRHGVTGGIPPTKNDHQRGLRDQVNGWSDSATRRNTRFLYSVNEAALGDGLGLAITLTLKDCPPSSDDWHKLRRAFIRRLERMGMIRCHWVTEWQRRGVPHLHGVVFFPEPENYAQLHQSIENHWLQVADAYRPRRHAQTVKPVTGIVGWFQYVSKHAARGVKHYQRSAENIPAGWHKTGRMWGHTGHWPIQEAERYELDREAWFAFRRVVRSWRIADARGAGQVRRVRQAKRMLRANKRETGEVRGVSEWLSQAQAERICLYLAAQGYKVRRPIELENHGPMETNYWVGPMEWSVDLATGEILPAGD